jgi:hypothetical protein
MRVAIRHSVQTFWFYRLQCKRVDMKMKSAVFSQGVGSSVCIFTSSLALLPTYRGSFPSSGRTFFCASRPPCGPTLCIGVVGT